MNLTDQLTEALDSAAAKHAASDDSVPAAMQTIGFPTAEGRFQIELTDLDSFACQFSCVAFLANRLATASDDQRQSIATDLERKLSYLLEPLRVIETDQAAETVQLRSDPPLTEDEGPCYFELIVNRQHIALRRYQQPRGKSRQQIPATVTREVLIRLAEDFTSAVPA